MDVKVLIDISLPRFPCCVILSFSLLRVSSSSLLFPPPLLSLSSFSSNRMKEEEEALLCALALFLLSGAQVVFKIHQEDA